MTFFTAASPVNYINQTFYNILSTMTLLFQMSQPSLAKSFHLTLQKMTLLTLTKSLKSLKIRMSTSGRGFSTTPLASGSSWTQGLRCLAPGQSLGTSLTRPCGWRPPTDLSCRATVKRKLLLGLVGKRITKPYTLLIHKRLS